MLLSVTLCAFFLLVDSLQQASTRYRNRHTDKELRKFNKGSQSPTALFLYTLESLAIKFFSEHVETKKSTVKLLNIIKNTLKNITYCKAIRFRFTVQ